MRINFNILLLWIYIGAKEAKGDSWLFFSCAAWFTCCICVVMYELPGNNNIIADEGDDIDKSYNQCRGCKEFTEA